MAVEKGPSSGARPVTIDYSVLEALQEREQRLAEAQRVANIGSWEWDVTRDRIIWSDQLYRVFGLPVQEFEPTYEGYLSRLHPEDRPEQQARVARALETHEPFEGLHRIITSAGDIRWIHSLGHVMVDPDGTPVRIYGTAQDVTGKVEQGVFALASGVAGPDPTDVDQSVDRSMFEPLTGLANRSLFDDRTRQALSRAIRMGWTTAVFAVDIDGFRQINERAGYAAGDAVLGEVARRLDRVIRPYDSVARPFETVARLGGDEFLLLCENVESTDAARAISTRIVAAFDEQFEVGRVSVGIGIAMVGPGGAKADALIVDAEAALRKAKSQGAAEVVTFGEGMRAQRRERFKSGMELRTALEEEQFVLHYQPKVLLANDRVVGVEALVRWEHPTLGMVPPDRFIPMAEETGLIVELGEWVLDEACRQAQQWAGRFPDRPPLVMAVNLSARQFRSELVPTVEDVIARNGIAPSSLCLEVTESIIMADVECTIAILGQLKSLGVIISIDDFGTGYSSLNYLRRFPLHELKIDRSFVDGLGEEAEDTAIVAAVVAMAHALELDVVAEGVETKDQLERLRVLGCEQVQGYYISRPLAAPALELFLADSDETESPGRGAEVAVGAYHPDQVVIADDSPEVLQLAAVSLTAAGFQVHQAENGRAAVDLARAFRPSCVVLDVRMPEMDGFAACRTLRADPAMAGCTIVMLTANAESADKVEGFSAGADDYIVKPFAPRDLVSRVRAAIRRHEERAEFVSEVAET